MTSVVATTMKRPAARPAIKAVGKFSLLPCPAPSTLVGEACELDDSVVTDMRVDVVVLTLAADDASVACGAVSVIDLEGEWWIGKKALFVDRVEEVGGEAVVRRLVAVVASDGVTVIGMVARVVRKAVSVKVTSSEAVSVTVVPARTEVDDVVLGSWFSGGHDDASRPQGSTEQQPMKPLVAQLYHEKPAGQVAAAMPSGLSENFSLILEVVQLSSWQESRVQRSAEVRQRAILSTSCRDERTSAKGSCFCGLMTIWRSA